MKTYQSFNFNKNLLKLRSMAKILNKDGLGTNDEPILNFSSYNFIVILHNFLIIEYLFQNEISDARYDINKHLYLYNLETVKEINDFILDISRMSHIIRDNIESFNRLVIIDDFLKETPEIFEYNHSGNYKFIRMKNGSFKYLKDRFLKNKQVRKFKI